MKKELFSWYDAISSYDFLVLCIIFSNTSLVAVSLWDAVFNEYYMFFV